MSLLDSAVAIWYSNFSMEKGLAIRRHFRSCTKKKISYYSITILLKSVTPFSALVGNLFMSQNQETAGEYCRIIPQLRSMFLVLIFFKENVAAQHRESYECHITRESNFCCDYEYNGIAERIRSSITIIPIMTVKSIYLSTITAIMRSNGP